MELTTTGNGVDAVASITLTVQIGDAQLTIAGAEPDADGWILERAAAQTVIDTWVAVDPASRAGQHEPALRAFVLGLVDADAGLLLDTWNSAEYADQFSTLSCPLGLAFAEMAPALDPVAIDALEGYAVPLDPMEDLQCDSCQ